MCQKEKRAQTEKEAVREEKWLTYHDRYTGGVPGLSPVILDLPIRFTETPRDGYPVGVFKNTQGRIVGWSLDEVDLKHINEDPCQGQHELVLKKLPLRIYIEVPTGKDKLPVIDGKKIYVLKWTRKIWTLGESVKVHRWGYPIVPDFGGTAHAYCGSTLKACIGDLLQWYTSPQASEALRAYMILSRTC